MPLSPEDVEAAFVATVQAQENGEPFNWQRLTLLLNQRLGESRTQHGSAFLLTDRGR